MNRNNLVMAIVVCCGLMAAHVAMAAASADEAATLKTTRTPLGGERAGNADGTIPAWDGSVPKAGGTKLGDVPTDYFAGEKPVVTITATNMSQYANKLSDGTQALLKKFADSNQLNVYPTHRTAVAPDWYYANTAKNATNCKLGSGKLAVEGCYGGVPFPIPKSGAEIIWNFLLRLEPESVQLGFKNIVGTADGNHTLATRNDEDYQFPYNFKDGSAESWGGEYFLIRFDTTAPPFKVGEKLVFRDGVDQSQPRQAWQYLLGQRRVRRAPTVGYDTPDFVASGANYFDEVKGFLGNPDRYEWKLVGKREMYVPYNENSFMAASPEEALSEHHLNPAKFRWELHRVWEVEATVAPGKRHAVPKRRMYFDEDTYILLLSDGYDESGKLWRTSITTPFVEPTVPAIINVPVIVHNLQANTFSVVQMLNGEYYRVVDRRPDGYFTGNALSEGAR